LASAGDYAQVELSILPHVPPAFQIVVIQTIINEVKLRALSDSGFDPLAEYAVGVRLAKKSQQMNHDNDQNFVALISRMHSKNHLEDKKIHIIAQEAYTSIKNKALNDKHLKAELNDPFYFAVLQNNVTEELTKQHQEKILFKKTETALRSNNIKEALL